MRAHCSDDGTASKEHKEAWNAELAFSTKYKEETGRHWTAYYPRPPPKLSMWDADFYHQTHNVTSTHGKFHCIPPRDER